jgi:hypothetical protein
MSDDMGKPYRLRISESYTPGTIPMARLADYMRVFAKLLGESHAVHFERIVDASVGLVARVDVPAERRVAERLSSLKTGASTKDARQAFDELDSMLREDNAVGALDNAEGAVIISFPGKMREIPQAYGPFWREGDVQGQVVSIGGRDTTVHVQLVDRQQVITGIEMTRELALRVKEHLFGKTIRLRGRGRHMRGTDGLWRLEGFKASSFEVLDDASFDQVVDMLRAVSGSEWGRSDDPSAALRSMRHDDETAH